ncbi:LuxR C-terminal-related transcriptional regulator [Nonomuraea sp. NPDC050786]|uniref:LuxR C-terminal-related transcriptional regulator n=1 Tax=Nonomuraea sp. NPDC050786 TaxID=3154840 RepID=UPI0033CF8987
MTGFVGRRQMVADARQLMSTARLLTIIGPGGIGKTRLALRVATEVRRVFPDGVWFVDLSGLSDAELVGRAVAVELGLRDQSDGPSIDVLSDHLADRRILLVLDNCEHLLDAVAMLATKLLGRAVRLKIVATSRHPLGVEGEQLLPVPPLTTPGPGELSSADSFARFEAVTLFADRARAARPTFAIDPSNCEQVALICRRLAGIPLAIELAAAQVRVLSVEQISNRLGDCLELPTRGRLAVAPRQRTLRASINWSFDLCSPQERTMWARLSVFAGGFDLEDAEQVCSGEGIERQDVFDLVVALVDKSVLHRDEHHYVQLEPIHEYGAELLAQSGDEARLRRRHRDWYRQQAAQADAAWLGPDQMRWLARLQREVGNLRTALAFCLAEPGGSGAALELVSRLWNYWIFVFGSYAEGRHYLDVALARETSPSPERINALWVNAWFALRQGDIEVAARLLNECGLLARSVDDTQTLVRVTHFTALVAFFRGKVRDAVMLLEEANDRYRAEADLAGSWMALCHLVMATSTAGDHERAHSYGTECLALCEAYSAYLSRSNALWAVGYGRWLQGDQRHAAALIADGLRVMRKTRDAWGVAECLEVLAWVAAADGDDDRATRLLGAARAAWRSTGTSIPGLRPLAACHDRCETALRARLGDRAFADALRAGEEGGVDDAVAYALDESTTREVTRTARPAQDALTPRERQVAELIAQGMKNKDIAATLVIASRTAEGHIEHIMQKLGFTSRSQIARWVTEQK